MNKNQFNLTRKSWEIENKIGINNLFFEEFDFYRKMRKSFNLGTAENFNITDDSRIFERINNLL